MLKGRKKWKNEFDIHGQVVLVNWVGQLVDENSTITEKAHKGNKEREKMKRNEGKKGKSQELDYNGLIS